MRYRRLVAQLTVTSFSEHSRGKHSVYIILQSCKPDILKIMHPVLVAMDSFWSTFAVAQTLQLSGNHCCRTRTYCMLELSFPAEVSVAMPNFPCKLNFLAWNGIKPQKQQKSLLACDSNSRPPGRPALHKPLCTCSPALKFVFINSNLSWALTANLVLNACRVRQWGACPIGERTSTALFIEGEQSTSVVVGLGDALYHCFSLAVFRIKE